MKKVVASVLVVAALCFLFDLADAAQKKKPATSPQTKKISPYERCKQLVAKHGGAELRVQRYRITKDGTLHCWYMA